MIPTMLVVSVVGGLFRRGWWLIPIATVAWRALLVAGDVIDLDLAVLGAAVLGGLNAAFGVGVGRMIRAVLGKAHADQPVPAR